jgi:3-hydroxybutyrate dehydrogenase
VRGQRISSPRRNGGAARLPLAQPSSQAGARASAESAVDDNTSIHQQGTIGMQFQNKTALVTGSTSGIGLGIARAFAREGADVILNGFGDAAEIEKLRASIAAEFGVKARYDGADMSRPEAIESMMRNALAEFVAIDILVNNAGIQHVAPVEEFPLAKWDAILAINLSAAFHTIRLALPAMKARKFGRIINVASAHALVASPFKGAYVAAKHGVAGLTKVVALEGAEHGVTANAICPGYVLTPLVEKQIPDTAKARGISEQQVIRDVLLAAQPTKQFVTVDQVAGLAVYLASDAAASTTGTIIPVDGGWTAH